MRLKRACGGAIVAALIIAVGYWVFCGIADRYNLDYNKTGFNWHGLIFIDLVNAYFKETKNSEYHYLKSSKEKAVSKDTHLQDMEGRIDLFFLNEKNLEKIKISIKHSDRTGNVARIYEKFCSDFSIGCTVILVDQDILLYPYILSSISEIARNPCNYTNLMSPAVTGYEPTYAHCGTDEDVFGTIYLGLVNQKQEVLAVLVIPRK